MVYRAIGLMSGSSLDGLDVVFVALTETGGKWSYEIKAATFYAYDEALATRLANATTLSAYDYLLLHSAYGKYLGEKVNQFIDEHHLHHQVQIIASHGHTTFHVPAKGFTAQLGDGAAIAATTSINVVSDLRAIDVALGGEGAPIVPIGERLLLSEYGLFLNLGGIANLSVNNAQEYIAFDICAANRVLNMLAELEGKTYDADGLMASSGFIDVALLTQLNKLAYYQKPYPKSLPNSFGVEEVYPIIKASQLSSVDALRTYVEHIAQQIAYAVNSVYTKIENKQLLITGGGAFNKFLVQRITELLKPFAIHVVVGSDELIQYKEALIMALLGVLRWREENTVLASVTGAERSSIGGAVWIGQEA